MIAVVDVGLSNVTSVVAALSRLNAEAVVTSDSQIIQSADHVILPGVGTAEAAMHALNGRGLRDAIRQLTCPVLGICLGMQLLFDSSDEGDIPVECLGVLEGKVRRIEADDSLPIPHMGWNQIYRTTQDEPLLQGIQDGAYVYFVHSFAVPVTTATLAKATYGQDFTAVAGNRNFLGCQFHPERSGEVGETILKNFLSI